MRQIKKEKERFFDDPNLVEYRTNLEGWTGPDGLYYGKGELGEQRARYANSTHRKCGKCGNSYTKNSYCTPCGEKESKERFLKLEVVEWDGVSMMASEDNFFSDMEEVIYYCEDNEIDINDLELMHCEKELNISEVNIDELNEECMTEGGEGVSEHYP